MCTFMSNPCMDTATSLLPAGTGKTEKPSKTPVPRNQAGLRGQHHFFSARKKKGEEGELTIFSFETEIFFLSSDAK